MGWPQMFPFPKMLVDYALASDGIDDSTDHFHALHEENHDQTNKDSPARVDHIDIR